MILALAGRRIDAPDTKHRRFPVENTKLVQTRIRVLLEEERPQALVSSAANGADLLALEVAGDLAIERQIVLPFPPEIFRATSVTDRPGEWGERFDRILADLGGEEHVICLEYPIKTRAAYVATNRAILERAQLIASREHDTLAAVIIWNGEPRGEQDETFEFKRAAESAGILVREVRTL